MIQILTQDNCPNCVSLKMYIEKALGPAYSEQIEYVNRTAEPERFNSLAKAHKIMSTPAVVAGEDVLAAPNVGNLKAFLDAHL